MKIKSITCSIFIFVIFLAGCFGPFDVYSPSQIHKTVQLYGENEYIVYYKRHYVIEQFGPDMSEVLRNVEDKDKHALWDQAIAVAVPKYLKAKNIVPVACNYGVVIIKSGETEGGGGYAVFRCKKIRIRE